MGEVIISKHPLVRHKQTFLRSVQTDPPAFRALVRELAQLLFFEAATDLRLEEHTVRTPLTDYPGQMIAERVGLLPILRAGLGMAEAVLDLLPGAQVWHLGLYRDHETLRPVTYYNKLPPVPTIDRAVVLDPMLASGGSAIAAIEILKNWGMKRIQFLGLIAAPEGVEALHTAHPDVAIYLAAVDEFLNDQCYIVPGLGDAGDRQFGTGG
ncbi:MAG: uracil phosphoribosyltransferase [Gemmataceae bacterium]|nr:uracil phosphoribosyltransferase [Gemmataceae bacterium]